MQHKHPYNAPIELQKTEPTKQREYSKPVFFKRTRIHSHTACLATIGRANSAKTAGRRRTACKGLKKPSLTIYPLKAKKAVIRPLMT